MYQAHLPADSGRTTVLMHLLVVFAFLTLLGGSDALKNGKYVLRVEGGDCHGKILAYPRYDKDYPGKVKLQSANASKPLMWEIKNSGGDTVTLQAINRAKNYPAKLSYSKNCRLDSVFNENNGLLKWNVISSGSNETVYTLKPNHCSDEFELGVSCRDNKVGVFEQNAGSSRAFTRAIWRVTTVSLTCDVTCNVCAACNTTLGQCVNSPRGTPCSGGICNGQGNCVPAASCSPACNECQNCHANKCSNLEANTPCSKGLCDGQGTCKSPPPPPQGCQSNAQCAAPTPICLSGKCVECAGDGDCSSRILAPLCINNKCSECPSGTYYEPQICKTCSICNGWFVFAEECSALHDTICTETVPEAPALVPVHGKPLQVKVIWTAPPSASPIISYTVQCMTAGYKPSATRSITVTGNPPPTEVAIGTDESGSNGPLVAGEIYMCRVSATNTEDESSFSPASPNFAPLGAKATYAPAKNPHIVTVTWSPLEVAAWGQTFVKYLVECTSYEGPSSSYTAEVSNISEGETIVYPLSAASTYDCSITVLTNDGASVIATTNSFSTALYLPLGTGLGDEYKYIYKAALSPDGKKLYACGYFEVIGNKNIPNIAEFDFATNSWGSLSNTEVDNNCFAVTFSPFDGKLYACGDFYSIGDFIARWDPKTRTWETIASYQNGYPNRACTDLAASSDGTIYASFTYFQLTTFVYKYNIKNDNAGWSSISGTGKVKSLLMAPTENVYLGGTNNGGNYVFEYNPKTDSVTALSSGSGNIDGIVRDIATNSNGDLFAAGEFKQPGEFVAMWDGSKWMDLGSGLGSYYAVDSVGVASNDNVYICSSFIAAWRQGDETFTILAELDGSCYDIKTRGVDVYVAGQFRAVNDDDTCYGITKTAAAAI